MSDYPKSTLNKVRRADRASYDQDAVFAILDAGLIAHVGFVDRGHPIVIPMLYGRIDDVLYLHGAKAARLIKLLGEGAPATVAVTLLDAIVVARSAFHSSMNYRSVVAYGTATYVTHEAEREAALTRITDHMLPGRWQEARPTSAKEYRATGVVRMPIDTASAKARSGMPGEDEEDYALPIWGGLVPIRTVFGPAQDDGRLAAGTAPPESIAALLARNIPATS